MAQFLCARLPNPTFNLAGVGLGYSFSIIFESPVILMLSASSALVKSATSYRRLRNFCLALSLALSIGLVIMLCSPVGLLLNEKLLGIDHTLYVNALTAARWFIPIPFAVGMRRFYQGILIRSRQSSKVTIGTLVRILAILGGGTVATLTDRMSGLEVGCVALACGMSAEAICARILVRHELALLSSKESLTNEYHYLGLLRFYFPLALTGMVNLSILPLLNFFMSKSPMPLESLAAYPVMQGLLYLFTAGGYALQEVIITSVSNSDINNRRLRNFTLLIGISSSALFALASISVIFRWWLQSVLGISPELYQFLKVVLPYASMMPLLAALGMALRGVIVHSFQTLWITIISILEIGIIVGTMLYFRDHLFFSGLARAVLALNLSRLIVFISLYVVARTSKAKAIPI